MRIEDSSIIKICEGGTGLRRPPVSVTTFLPKFDVRLHASKTRSNFSVFRTLKRLGWYWYPDLYRSRLENPREVS